MIVGLCASACESTWITFSTGTANGDPQSARELIARRSYKSDEKARQTPERLIARKDLVTALEQGRTRAHGGRVAMKDLLH